jgi:hypothetical protein
LLALTVDFPARPHPEDQHHQAVVLDLANEPVVAHAVLPELPEPWALQRLAQCPRVVEFRQSLVKELQDSLLVLRVELAEFPIRGLRQFNALGHDVSLHL